MLSTLTAWPKRNCEAGAQTAAPLAALQLQNFSRPLTDTKGHFSNPGVFAGTQLGYHAKGTMFQNVLLGYINRGIGDGLFVNSQMGIRSRVVAILQVLWKWLSW